jgi:hypothetical protein
MRNNIYRAALLAAIATEGVLPSNSALGQHEQVAFANESRFNEAFFDIPLTGYAVGWRDPHNIEGTLEFFAPEVMVPRRFTYAEATNAEEFLADTNDEDIRQIGGDFKQVKSYTETKTSAETANKGLTMRVDMDQVADKANWQEYYTGKLIRRLLRIELKRAIALLSAAATNTARTWDTTAGKDPDYDLLGSLITAETASGIRPNRVGFGDTSWQKRALAHRAQNTAGGFASAGLSEAQVAALLGVESVLVSRERYQSTASAKAEVVSNLVLSFYARSGVDTEDPANIKRFVSNVDGGGKRRVFLQQISAKIWELTIEHYSLLKITSTLGIRKETIS